MPPILMYVGVWLRSSVDESRVVNLQRCRNYTDRERTMETKLKRSELGGRVVNRCLQEVINNLIRHQSPCLFVSNVKISSHTY